MWKGRWGIYWKGEKEEKGENGKVGFCSAHGFFLLQRKGARKIESSEEGIFAISVI